MKILFITSNLPKYFYRFASTPIAEEVEQYIRDRELFIRTLNNKDNLYVRLYSIDYGWNQEQRLTKEFPNLLFDVEKKINYKRYDLVVIDHPVTSMLEVFISNVPVIMFWNHSIWKMNYNFRKYYPKLFKNNIYLICPITAANFINIRLGSKIGIKEWWETRDQNLINNFKKEFTSTKNQMIQKILKEIKNE